VTTPAMIGVGTLATGITAVVDEHGTVHQGALRLGWRVRSETDADAAGSNAQSPGVALHSQTMIDFSPKRAARKS